MTAISREKLETESASIDLTPMLDVVFIMLIFFIVTASFIREATIRLDRPPPGNQISTTEQKDIVVLLQADNQVVINGRIIDHRSLRAYFERHIAANPESALVIRASNKAKTFAVARIANAAREARLFKIVLVNFGEAKLAMPS